MNVDFPAYTASIHHDGSERYVLASPERNLRLGDRVTLRLRTGREAPVQRILLRTAPDGEQQLDEMQPEPDPASQEPCRWWQARLSLHMPVTGYRFLIFTPDGAWWLNGRGLQAGWVTDAEDFRLLAGYQSPSWVPQAVFYQIFPDRFADGDPANNVRTGEYVYQGAPSAARQWGEEPSKGLPAMVEFFGGDLAGIQQRLDYIQDLGANALYLNPIFTALSSHRYDVIDYFNVDPHLGGNQALADLRQATRERGMRLVLDIVPNHCGVEHPWFRQAQADPHSPVADFFSFFSHPEEYAAWLGVRSLPKLNYRSLALREKMYAGPGSVFRTWLEPPYSIDGWRLDVANMLARQGADQLELEVGREIRRAMKETNPEAYLLAENFFDASPQLQGDLWDAAMNYSGFAKPLWFWLGEFAVYLHPGRVVSEARWPTRALLDSWQAFRAAIPWAIARQQFNLLGSHDTGRILEGVGGYRALVRLAFGLLMTYVGVPSIYYGDEIGMGTRAGSTRDCMPWDTRLWDMALREDVQALARLRRSSPALMRGGFQVLDEREDSFVFQRDAEGEVVLVAANRGPEDRAAFALRIADGGVPDGVEFKELFSGQARRVEEGRLELPALAPGIQIWR